MKEKKLEGFLEETLKDRESIEKVMEDIQIPKVEDTMEAFKKNIKKEDDNVKGREDSNKNGFKRYGMIAAALALVVTIPAISQMKNINSPTGPKTNIEGPKNPGGDGMQIPNPLKYFDTVKEAEDYAGFKLEEANYIPDGYERFSIIGIGEDGENKLLRVIYKDGEEGRFTLEKFKKDSGIKSDWENYDKTENIKIGDKEVTLSYKGDTLAKAEWNDKEYELSLFLNSQESEESKIDRDELSKIIENIK